MAEPSSTGGLAIAAGTVTLTGSILGIQYDALLAGLFGGLVALSWLPPMSIRGIAGSVAASTLMAGWFAQVCAIAAVHYFPWVATAGDQQLRIAAGAALGLFWQTLIPSLLQLAKRKIDGGKS